MPAISSTDTSNGAAAQPLSNSSGYTLVQCPRSPVSEKIEWQYSEIKNNLDELPNPHTVGNPAAERIMRSHARAQDAYNADADTFLYLDGHREVRQANLTTPRAFVCETGELYTRTYPELLDTSPLASAITPSENMSLVERTRRAAEHRKHMREKLRQDMGADNWLNMVKKMLKQEANRKKKPHAADLRRMHASAAAVPNPARSSATAVRPLTRAFAAATTAVASQTAVITPVLSSSAGPDSSSAASQVNSGIKLRLRLGMAKPKARESNLRACTIASPTKGTSGTLIQQVRKRKNSETAENLEERSTKKPQAAI
ncbi:hypothetical protein SLS56_008291 [Neofusicoccum ribis]|uniref:Uncharacterized protein n=1 Tax=Neofusicoccum ribis TaxID=45134 RepID=A0ABR3SKH1_9PEZI